MYRSNNFQYILHCTHKIPTLHCFLKLSPLWRWSWTQCCICLYNWDLCPICCPASSSTRCPSTGDWWWQNVFAPLIWLVKAVETKHFFAVTLNWKPNLVFILLLYMRKSRPDESQSLEMSARFHSNLAAFRKDEWPFLKDECDSMMLFFRTYTCIFITLDSFLWQWCLYSLQWPYSVTGVSKTQLPCINLLPWRGCLNSTYTLFIWHTHTT